MKYEGNLNLYRTTNGEVWAQQFIEQFGLDIELDDVRAWFANAIECGRSHGYSEFRKELEELHNEAL